MRLRRNYHFSVFREGQNWAAQVLALPDEKVIRFRVFRSQTEARTCLSGWRRQYQG